MHWQVRTQAQLDAGAQCHGLQALTAVFVISMRPYAGTATCSFQSRRENPIFDIRRSLDGREWIRTHSEMAKKREMDD